MTELNEQISKELDDMCESLSKAKISLEKKFISILEEFTEEAFENFYYIVENDTRYNFDYWVRRTCDEIVMGLLSGNTQWLKQQSIISEYTWEKVQAVRLAIWNTAGAEIANSTIFALQEEIERLKKENKSYREQLHRNY